MTLEEYRKKFLRESCITEDVMDQVGIFFELCRCDAWDCPGWRPKVITVGDEKDVTAQGDQEDEYRV